MDIPKVAKIVLSPEDNCWHYRMYGSIETLCGKIVSMEVALAPTMGQEVIERLSGREPVNKCPMCAKLLDYREVWHQEAIGAPFKKGG